MMFKVGTKIKNKHTGECRVIASVDVADNPPQPVYVTDDGVRRDTKNMMHWALDE